ncbi:hypothetical protein TSUD_305780 [Trifolium subterraneum]|uniref:Uncharacterized protein n=1 Tax=Trifolium subterraneum TaxID=3900 RepID=A0A2Z6MIJ8_TRISU|nr:hypothetical protein TSUD_305780 [Trifolium subterraneum]
MDHDDPSKHRVLTLLNALKEASKDLQIKTNPFTFLFKTDSKSAIEALLELESKAIAIFSTHPNLHNLSHSLTTLKTLIENLQNCKGYGLKSIFQRQIIAYKISQASSILESQIQIYLDRVIIINLVKTLQEHHQNEEEQVKVIVEFEQRLSKGFDLEFQDLILKAKVFTLLERVLIEPFSSKRVKEQSAMAIAELVKFNKNVFVGFAIQLEVGEGLSSDEKREVKLEILRLVKEASRSDAEFATISAEILWGSSP